MFKQRHEAEQGGWKRVGTSSTSGAFNRSVGSGRTKIASGKFHALISDDSDDQSGQIFSLLTLLALFLTAIFKQLDSNSPSKEGGLFQCSSFLFSAVDAGSGEIATNRPTPTDADVTSVTSEGL